MVKIMLACYRVLDLSNEKGFLCAKTLGDLGAEVIKIEPPGGDEGRYRGPYYKGVVHPEKSLYWFAFNQNKKSITLDIKAEEGKKIFRRLVKTADIVVESFEPGKMDALGLGYQELSRINPEIILTSISDFGRQGPYRDYKGSDLVLYAMSGLMFVTGDPDRPPLGPSYPHAYLFGAMQGAIGSLIALFQRHTIKTGQHVDTSVQMSLTWVSQPDVFGLYDLFGEIAQRTGRVRRQPFNGIEMPILWECKDGDIGYCFMFGPGNAKANARLAEWIENDTPSVTAFQQINWETIKAEEVSEEMGKQIYAAMAAFFKNHTKEELLKGSLERNIQLYPSMTPTDTLTFEQLQTRNFWQQVHHPDLNDTLVYPGPAAKISGLGQHPNTDKIEPTPAPRIGEHNEKIFIDELGLSKKEVMTLKQKSII